MMSELESGSVKRRRSSRRKDAPESDQVSTTDAVDIAMKAVASGAVPGDAAQVVLERHAGLLEIQCLREQEELANVRVQRITRWLILATVAGLLLAALALIWNASRS